MCSPAHCAAVNCGYVQTGWPVTPGHEIVGRESRRPRAAWQTVLFTCPSGVAAARCVYGHEHLQVYGGSWSRGVATRWWICRVANVPEQCLIEVPDDVPTHLAPSKLPGCIDKTAGHGIRMARRVVESGRVLVIGAGPLAFVRSYRAGNGASRHSCCRDKTETARWPSILVLKLLPMT